MSHKPARRARCASRHHLVAGTNWAIPRLFAARIPRGCHLAKVWPLRLSSTLCVSKRLSNGIWQFEHCTHGLLSQEVFGLPFYVHVAALLYIPFSRCQGGRSPDPTVPHNPQSSMNFTCQRTHIAMGFLIYATDPHIIHLTILSPEEFGMGKETWMKRVLFPIFCHDFPTVFTGRNGEMEGS